MMSAVMPRSRAPSAAAFTAEHHSGLSHGRSGKAARPSFGTSSRIAIVLISNPPMPAAFITSSWRRISASVTREPFHHQRTKGRRRWGGLAKLVEQRVRGRRRPAPRGHAQEAEERERAQPAPAGTRSRVEPVSHGGKPRPGHDDGSTPALYFP